MRRRVSRPQLKRSALGGGNVESEVNRNARLPGGMVKALVVCLVLGAVYGMIIALYDLWDDGRPLVDFFSAAVLERAAVRTVVGAVIVGISIWWVRRTEASEASGEKKAAT